jgi:hypothetical protein
VPKVAVTEFAALKATLQVAFPVHPPLQPEKMSLVAGVSLSVTWLFCGKLAEHVAGQLIPAGLLVTVPVPAPAMATDMVTVIGEPGGVLDPTTPRQPASARVNRADSNINQNVYRDFIGELLLTERPNLDENEYKMVVCCRQWSWSAFDWGVTRTQMNWGLPGIGPFSNCRLWRGGSG